MAQVDNHGHMTFRIRLDQILYLYTIKPYLSKLIKQMNLIQDNDKLISQWFTEELEDPISHWDNFRKTVGFANQPKKI